MYSGAVKALLQSFPYDFLYGTLAADITLGKDYVDYIYNCHNWRVGFLILNEAEDDRQRAAAMGYLAHLSVDIIAHNYFVPYKIIRSYPTLTLGHVYWEMRYDSKRPKKIWALARKLSEMNFEHNDDLFEKMLKRTIFSFKTNKRIFKSVLNLHRIRHWKTAMEKLHDVSRFKMTDADMDEYRTLALASLRGFLENPDEAPCTRVDPTGADKLLYATEMRKEIRTLTRKKLIGSAEVEQLLAKIKESLRDSIYKSRSLPTAGEII